MNDGVIKKGIRNTVYVVAAQSISLILGIVRTLILPILLGIENFGYWQVYLLYMSYVGIFALGFNDGIYLRYGKYDYDELPKKTFRTSIKLFCILQIVITIIISTIILFEPDSSKQISILWASINIPIAGLTGVLIYILQITNQLKKYSFYTILDKIIVLAIIIGLFLLKVDNFVLIILTDTLARVVVLCLMINSCKEIIFGKGIKYSLAFKEIIDNVRIGIKLMLANFAGMLVLGFGRFLIERTASIEEYATYSFAISTMNLVLVIITAVGQVVYPTLNRLDRATYPNYFKKLNQILTLVVLGLLITIFPLKVFISLYMKEYTGIFDYLAIVFAIIFVQSKMQILINPFYKLLRKESIMLKANLIGFFMAVVLVTPIYLLTNSVTMVAVGTFIAMLIRLYLSEIYLKKELNIVSNKNIVFELIELILFLLLASSSHFYVGLGCYLVIYLVILIKNIQTLKVFAKYLLRR